MNDIIESTQEAMLVSLVKHLQKSEYIEDFRDYLDLTNPQTLYDCMMEGLGIVMESDMTQIMSSETSQNFRITALEIERSAEKLLSIWHALDHFEENQVWIGIDEVTFSDDSFWGAVAGTVLLPGLGTAIGMWWGQSRAMKRMLREVQEVTEYYNNGFSNFIDQYEDSVTKVLVPSISNDIYIAKMVIEEEARKQKEIEEEARRQKEIEEEARRQREIEEAKRNEKLGFFARIIRFFRNLFT